MNIHTGGEGAAEDEMVRQHHQLHGHESEQTLGDSGASLVAQMVKNPPVMPETWVRSLGWEDPLEMGMATHSSILAWKIRMDGTWRGTIHGVTKSQTQLSN